MERIIVVLKNGSRSKVKHKIFAYQVSLSNGESQESLEEQVSNSGENKVLLLPLQFDKSLFGRHVEAQESLEEFSSLHVLLKPILVPKHSIILKQLQEIRKLPLSEVFEPQHFGQINFVVEFSIVKELVIIIIEMLQVDLEVGNYLLVVHTLAIGHLIEVFIGFHEELWEVIQIELLLHHPIVQLRALANHRTLEPIHALDKVQLENI